MCCLEELEERGDLGDSTKTLKTKNSEKNKESGAGYSLIEDNPCCRFCYSKSLSRDNNFILLCKCEGFSKYIHERCLSEWLFMKGKFFTEKSNKNHEASIYVAQKTAF